MTVEEFTNTFKIKSYSIGNDGLFTTPKLYTSHELEVLPDIKSLSRTKTPVIVQNQLLYILSFWRAQHSIDVTWVIAAAGVES